jgi:hypothetical protein
VAEAFRDVPLPEGLSDRIMARLAAATNGKKAAVADPKPQGPPIEEPTAEQSRPEARVRLKWVLAGAVSAAVAASLIVAIVLRSGQQQVADSQTVLDGAGEFFRSDREAKSQLVSEAEPPEAYPTYRGFGVHRFPQIRWRNIRGFLGRSGVAYDLNAPRMPPATLYVVKCAKPIPGLPNAVPRAPMSTTGGQAVSAWQQGGLLYVLVIEDSRAYRSFLPRSTFT